MDRFKAAVVALLIGLYTANGLASGPAVVSAMHYPAWLVRDFKTEPLTPGTVLQVNDLLRTGEHSRVQVELADGGVIRLGQKTRFIVEQLDASEQLSGTDRAAVFQLLRGSLEYTARTTAAGEISRTILKVGTISAEFAAADVWAASIAEREIIGLIAGEATVRSNTGNPRVLDQSLSLYVKSESKPAAELKRIDADQLARWSGVTRLDDSLGVANRNGEWQLVLISLTRRPQADMLLAQMREQGFAVELKSVLREGRTLHRLLLPGFVSIEAALAARTRIEAAFGITDAWVWKSAD